MWPHLLTPLMTGQYLDIFARAPLYSRGLDYRHGTGHGVGSFLNVHEGPHGISRRASASAALVPGMIVTNGMSISYGRDPFHLTISF